MDKRIYPTRYILFFIVYSFVVSCTLLLENKKSPTCLVHFRLSILSVNFSSNYSATTTVLSATVVSATASTTTVLSAATSAFSAALLPHDAKDTATIAAAIKTNFFICFVKL